ncbi:ubiquitin 3 binding protein But2 C-terminal domain-containing protein [Biscogniauxia mediterranea]|nr:ubiquitin 3 binding protein But2 C-terminal domain-containing protein [Biscogniauxia mediterranea]
MLYKPTVFLSVICGTYALTTRQDACAFTLTTGGSVTALVGQYGSGQTRAGLSETPSKFVLEGDTIVDNQGRGCWWTPPALVLQCDVGQIPETGFNIGCDGSLSYNGQTTFYECVTGVDDIVMIYREPNGSNCGKISLEASECSPDNCSSSKPPSTATMTLTGDWQSPRVIIPIDSSQPDTCLGPTPFVEVSATVSTVFRFDIPASYGGRTCTAVFLWPEREQVSSSSYNFTGVSAIGFARLEGGEEVSAEATTFNSLPEGLAQTSDLYYAMAPRNNAYALASFECPAGAAVAFVMSSLEAAAAAGETSFRYRQDPNPCPLGLYITASGAA